MRLGAGLGLLMVATGAWGEEVAVGLQGAHQIPLMELQRAKATAERIYSGIGIRLKWSTHGNIDIWLQFDLDAPQGVPSDSLAYATPYGEGGTRVNVLLNRVRATGPQWPEGVVLGHVIAHELGHVLQGIARHADRGVMKAHWEQSEFNRMLAGPLAFTEGDAELIHSGLARMRR